MTKLVMATISASILAASACAGAPDERSAEAAPVVSAAAASAITTVPSAFSSSSPSGQASPAASPKPPEPAVPSAPEDPPPGRLCVVMTDVEEKTPRPVRGWFDETDKLAWITVDGSDQRRRVVWDGERLARVDRMRGDDVVGGTRFEYGARGELLRVSHLRDGRDVEWWRGAYKGSFGAAGNVGPLLLYLILDNRLTWPPHLPLVDGLALPAFTGRLEVTVGWPDPYDIECDIGKDKGRCVDDYDRVAFLRGLLIERTERPKPDVTKETSRHYAYDGARLTRIVNKGEGGEAVYESTFSYDADGRLVEARYTNFGTTKITRRLVYRCQGAR